MLTRIILAALAACGACTIASAQGYFDFGQIPGVPDEPTVQIDLDPWLLGFVGEAARASNPATAEVLIGLSGVRVRVYETLQDAAAVGAFVDDRSQVLERDGWRRVVYVQDGSDKVRIYVKADEQQVSGMTVMVVDSTEAVFINIAGSIDPAQLGRVAAAMGIDGVLPTLGPSGGANGEQTNPMDR